MKIKRVLNVRCNVIPKCPCTHDCTGIGASLVFLYVRFLSWCRCCLRPDFMPPDDEGHLATPRIYETGPAGVQGNVVSILTAQTHWGMLEWRLARVLQHYARHRERKTTERVGKMLQTAGRIGSQFGVKLNICVIG